MEGIEMGGGSNTINSGMESIEMDVASKVQGGLGGASKVKVSWYGRVLRKRAN
jgi:hypothetical protein